MDNGRMSLLTRTMLRDQAYDHIRNWIITGVLSPGAKIAERALAEELGVSRAPIKDALLKLKREGFVVIKSSGRYVKSFTADEVKQIYAVRLRLEPLAAELAASYATPASARVLSAKLNEFAESCHAKNLPLFAKIDMEIHSLIWEQAGNSYLQSALDVIAAPTFMLVPNCARYVDDNWTIPLQEHVRVVESINLGDADTASRAMEEHIAGAFSRSLRVVSMHDHQGQGRSSIPSKLLGI